MKNDSPLNFKALLVVIHDVLASGTAWGVAYWLRFNLQIPEVLMASMLYTLIWVVPVQAAIFWFFGLYRGIWRYASLHDLKRIVGAVGIATLSVSLILLMIRPEPGVPRSVLLLDPILLTMMMAGSRVMYRLWKEHRLYGLLSKRGEPVLVLGAGDAAVTLVKELMRSSEWRVVGLLDDDVAKRGRLLQGVKVLGGLDELPLRAAKLGVKHAILAMPAALSSVRRHAVEICSAAGVNTLTVPSFGDLMSGRVTVSQIRKVEVEDLLGRDAVLLDHVGMHDFLTNQVVMVTGAGGSIGSELCRQIANFGPSLLVMLELNEFALYRLQEEFSQYFPDTQVIAAVGDVKNRHRVNQILRQYPPAVIFHAAAYKHVPLMEDVNAWEAVRNNVLGTFTMASAAIANNIKKFVLISTDKAVNPTNVMGASKRLAEMLCQAMQQPMGTRFEMVRFGNVLGSTGSVIPKFSEQIEKGGPITVTHPDIIRYFMSIPEAAQLVLQAGCMGQGGEIFVMDMGEPVKIADLARGMIRLSGFSEEEIKIVYTGLRPGEKLFEELLADDEHTRLSDHPKLRIAKAREIKSIELEKLIPWLEQERDLSDDEVRRDLKRWVPEYSTAAKPKLKVM